MEVQYVVEALSKNPAWLDDLIAADERQRRKAMGRLLNLPAEDRAANVNQDLIKEKLASLDPKRPETHVSEWARRAGRQQEYELAFMLLSGDVHASPRGAESHLVLNAAGELEGITALPDADELPFRLMSACDSMLAVLWVLPDGVCRDAARERISALAGDERKRAINERALKRIEESAA